MFDSWIWEEFIRKTSRLTPVRLCISGDASVQIVRNVDLKKKKKKVTGNRNVKRVEKGVFFFLKSTFVSLLESQQENCRLIRVDLVVLHGDD